MLDLLLRWSQPRRAAALAVLALAAWGAWEARGILRAKLSRPAADVGLSGSAPEILQAKEKRESDAFVRRYAALMVKLEEARQQGFEVSGLEAAARAALPLNRPDYRATAVRKLNEVEMAIPVRRTADTPVGTARPEDVDESELPKDIKPGRQRPRRGRR